MSKNCHFNTIRGSEFWFLWKFALLEDLNLPNQQNAITKTAVLELFHSLTLISRKIWVKEKGWNFHTLLSQNVC